MLHDKWPATFPAPCGCTGTVGEMVAQTLLEPLDAIAISGRDRVGDLATHWRGAAPPWVRDATTWDGHLRSFACDPRVNAYMGTRAGSNC